MVRSKRTAFTLVELLVVITIIGMLMAILLPAVGAATESARAAQCKNRVKNIALAMANYESRNSGFSGYIDGAEDREGNTVPFSWLIAVMPDLERQDVYDRWTDPLPRNRQEIMGEPPFLDFLVCPSDPPLQKVALTSYVANAGLDEEDAPGCGVLHTALPLRSKRTRKKIIHQRTTLDKLAAGDGASNTILVSENIQASTWNGLSFFVSNNTNEAIPAPKPSKGQPPHNVMIWGNHKRSGVALVPDQQRPSQRGPLVSDGTSRTCQRSPLQRASRRRERCFCRWSCAIHQGFYRIRGVCVADVGRW